jgi:hypothetical protein
VKKTFETFFVPRMLAARSRTVTKIGIASRASAAMRGTMISIAPNTTNPPRCRSPIGVWNVGGIKLFSHDLRRVCWPLNFMLLGIDKYDGSTNSAEWLKVYQLAIEAAGGDSYVMINYLPIYLSSSAKPWLMEFPTLSVRSWSDLCRQFIINFWATCERPGVDWDLASVIQKNRESLEQFIQCFYNKRNMIPEVNDKSIIMFFKKGLRDSSLICKLSMKNLRMSEEMLAIANKYALDEEAPLDNRDRDSKKD